MDTVAEVVAAAARLRPDELQELPRQIERLTRLAGAVTLQVVGPLAVRMARVDDADLYRLLRRSLAIQDDLARQAAFTQTASVMPATGLASGFRRAEIVSDRRGETNQAIDALWHSLAP